MNPRSIVNPYTMESMVVECGKCPACLLKKSSHYKLLCQLESFMHARTYFVTLTYADAYIPRCEYSDGYLYDSSTGEQLSDEFAFYSQDYYERLQRKVKCAYIPYLLKPDLQLFLKRLRKFYETKYGYKLRYFAVGEYGPAHFRPHYHLLLWFDTAQVVTDLPQVICQKWSFGRTDVQIAQGDCSSYVAGYANSFGSVPSILQNSRFAPFCCHSQRLGLSYLEATCEEVYSCSFDTLMQRSFPVNGSIKEFRPWRSAIAAYFPKCVGYSYKSSQQRLDSYTLMRTARKYFPTESKREIAILTYKYVSSPHSYHACENDYRNFMHHFYLATAFDGVPYKTADLDKEKFYIDSIYRELLISDKFLSLCDSSKDYLSTLVGPYYGQFSSVEHALLSKIEKFWKDYDYMLLTNNLSVIEELSSTFAIEDIMLSYCPDYAAAYAQSTEIGRIVRRDIMQRFDDSIKHKKQNDINNLLNY